MTISFALRGAGGKGGLRRGLGWRIVASVGSEAIGSTLKEDIRTMDKPTSREEQFEKLKDLTKDIQICMMTTIEPDGTLRSRPMQSQDTDENGDLWFFTSVQSGKVSETKADPRVNLAFASGDRQRYVSVSGRATLVRDPAKAKELWKPILKAWFPGGLEDPNLALLRVSIEEAEYWDDKASRMVSFLRMVHSAVTGAEYEAEHGRLKA